MEKKYKWPYLLAVFVFLISGLSFISTSAQTATLSVILDSNPGGGSAPLTGLTMTASVSGTATGPINYYFYCNAANDSSTTVIPGYAYSVIGTNSTVVTTPAGICDTTYENIGTYLAKVIVERGGMAREERRTVGVFNPVPAVDLKIRLIGTTDLFDAPITVSYNSQVEILWRFSGFVSCDMFGDWTGTKDTTPGQETTSNLTEGRSYVYTLRCGSLSDSVMVIVLPPTLFGSISVAPSSGIAPLSGVILAANVTGGTAVGTVNYTFYCNRSDTGINITSGWAYKLDNINSLTLSAPADACNSVYANVGTYTAKVIIERGGIAREYRIPITVNSPPPPTVDLTADDYNIAHNASTTLRWIINNATTCTPQIPGPLAWTSSGDKAIPTGSWPTGNLTGPATYTYWLSCTGLGGTRSDSVSINVAAPPAPVINITADSYNIAYDSSTTIRWTISNASASCTATNGTTQWRSTTKSIPSGSESTGNLTGTGTNTFTISCTGAGGTRSGSVNIVVGSPPQRPSVELIAQGWPMSAIVPYGTNVTLEWIVEGADTCEGTGTVNTGGWQGLGKNPNGGSAGTGNLVGPDIYIYTITCSNAGGSSSNSVTINVLPPPPDILSFTASPNIVNYGDPATLEWESDFATSCTGNWPGASMLSTDGSLTSGPLNTAGTRTFTLTCVGPGNQQDTASVNVTVNGPPPPIINVFQARQVMPAGQEGVYRTSSLAIDYNSAVEFNWESDATRCAITATDFTRSALPASGTQRTNNLTAVDYLMFTLTCTGPGGDSESMFNVIIGSPPLPTVTLLGRPSGESVWSSEGIYIDFNTFAELRWEATNATRCELSGDWRGTGTSGTRIIPNIAREQNYSITCYNAANNSVFAAFTVSIEPGSEQPQDQSIIFENPIEQGDLRGILDSLSGLIQMIAIALAAIMIIISGIIILTSVDDRERLNKGKNMLKWSLIGLAVSLASSFIIGFIEEIISAS